MNFPSNDHYMSCNLWEISRWLQIKNFLFELVQSERTSIAYSYIFVTIVVNKNIKNTIRVIYEKQLEQHFLFSSFF